MPARSFPVRVLVSLARLFFSPRLETHKQLLEDRAFPGSVLLSIHALWAVIQGVRIAIKRANANSLILEQALFQFSLHTFVLLIAAPLIYAIIHFTSRLLGGRGDFLPWFGIAFVLGTIVPLVHWIVLRLSLPPILSSMFGLYVQFLLVLALRANYGLGWWKAVGALLLGGLFALPIALVVLILAYPSMLAVPNISLKRTGDAGELIIAGVWWATGWSSRR